MADVQDSAASTSPTPKPKTVWSRALDFVVWVVKDQWFLIGIVFVIIISSQVQVPKSQQATKQVIVSYLSGKDVKPQIQSSIVLTKDSVANLLRHWLYLGYQNTTQ